METSGCKSQQQLEFPQLQAETLAANAAKMLSQNPSGDSLRRLTTSFSASSYMQLTAGEETCYKYAAQTYRESKETTRRDDTCRTRSVSVDTSTSPLSINTGRASSFRSESRNQPHFRSCCLGFLTFTSYFESLTQ